MKWKRISTKLATLQVFNLVSSFSTEGVVRCNHLQQTVRIQYKNRQRLFFIEQASPAGTRFLFRNEYGFEVGKLLIEKTQPQGGVIELENKRFHYRIHSEPVSQMVIYEYDMVKPLAMCEFTNDTNSRCEFASLLLGLGCYLMDEFSAMDYTVAATAALFA